MAMLVGAATAVLLRIGDPHQPELTELANDLVREPLGAIELLGHGPDLALGEVAHEAPDVLLLGGEVEVHVGAGSYPAPGGGFGCASRLRESRSPRRGV